MSSVYRFIFFLWESNSLIFYIKGSSQRINLKHLEAQSKKEMAYMY